MYSIRRISLHNSQKWGCQSLSLISIPCNLCNNGSSILGERDLCYNADGWDILNICLQENMDMLNVAPETGMKCQVLRMQGERRGHPKLPSDNYMLRKPSINCKPDIDFFSVSAPFL